MLLGRSIPAQTVAFAVAVALVLCALCVVVSHMDLHASVVVFRGRRCAGGTAHGRPSLPISLSLSHALLFGAAVCCVSGVFLVCSGTTATSGSYRITFSSASCEQKYSAGGRAGHHGVAIVSTAEAGALCHTL